MLLNKEADRMIWHKDPKKINTILLSVTQISVAENLQYFKHRFQLVRVSHRERKRARKREGGMNS